MAFKIGFITDRYNDTADISTPAVEVKPHTARKSVVQIYFPQRNMSLAYYNDRFDLKSGDLVYVDGKLEGKIGRVTSVNYNFKIKLSDYKRVIAVLDTDVDGQLFIGGSFFLSFDRNVLPKKQVRPWFISPVLEEEQYSSGTDDTSFSLDELHGMNVSNEIAQRGYEYYTENRVKYLSLDGTSGYALVDGREVYEIEFEYKNGNIESLVCSCFCSYNCKHEFAVMLQLQELLSIIDEKYHGELQHSGFFAAINKGTFFTFAIDSKDTGSFTLER